MSNIGVESTSLAVPFLLHATLLYRCPFSPLVMIMVVLPMRCAARESWRMCLLLMLFVTGYVVRLFRVLAATVAGTTSGRWKLKFGSSRLL